MPVASGVEGLATAAPLLHLLSNGRYRAGITTAGAGFSCCERYAMSRWTPDRVRDADGFFFYLRDLDSGAWWSAGLQPVPPNSESYAVEFGSGVARISRTDHGIDLRLECAVDVDADVEVRRLLLTNRSTTTRHIEITTFAEVALNTPAADAGHPAFSKLFVSTEAVSGGAALLARRRQRSPEEEPLWLMHALLATRSDGPVGPASWETDRLRFLGRGRTAASPAALMPGALLSGTVGNVLDPVVSLRRVLTLPPGASGEVVARLGFAHDREAALGLIPLEPDLDGIFVRAAERDRELRRRHGITGEIEKLLPLLSGALCYGHPDFYSASSAEAVTDEECAALGLDRKLPVVAVHVGSEDDAPTLDLMTRVAAWWQSQGMPVDLRVLTGESGRREAHIIESVTRMVVHHPVAPTRSSPCAKPTPARSAPSATPPAPRSPEDAGNGYGGFSPDGSEYIITIPADGRRPPLPWSNVIANEEIGFIATESGAGNTWSVNSREHRLTPWFNDPVSDPHGEAFYLRDEATGVFWSPTPGPVPSDGAHEVRHGFGYTSFHRRTPGLIQELVQFVPRHGCVKLSRLSITNSGGATRRLTLFAAVQWVLGVLPSDTAASIVTSRDSATGAIFAQNSRAGEFSERVAFATLIGPHGPAIDITADRATFLGRHGSLACPAALRTDAPLDGRTGRGLDPGAHFRLPFTVEPGQTVTCLFLLGDAASEPDARDLIGRFGGVAAADAALATVRRFWRDTVSAVQVHTPSPAIDLMLNGWLAYQNLSCRIWGRSAFYQSGGAFGFRDQLQDAAALLWHDPQLARTQILLHAAHQFVEGDVLHWWHPPLSKGIRTRFSDDLLWLPLLTSSYVAQTGDTSVVKEQARFLTAPVLKPGEDEIFLLPEDSGTSADLYEHCCRAMDRSLTRGAHGLPLIGTGDWNDGMNRVGREGRGESTWLGFFLARVLEGFIPLAESRGDTARLVRYRDYLRQLHVALNDGGWDGGWYRRGYYDNGTPLGSAKSDECRIDAIAQAWAVLSGVAPAERATQALDALEQHLVSESDGIIRLLTPPFDQTPEDPGYIKGYLPGVRENGGQYTHGALWAVQALAEAGRGDRAAALLTMLSPVTHGATPAAADRYQVEPYVIAADVYGVAPHVGRGGWTWYTGSAGWMFRVAVESVLGIALEGGNFIVVRPALPLAWPGYSFTSRLPDGRTTLTLTVERAAATDQSATNGTLDGQALAVVDGAVRIPLPDDGATHTAAIRFGAGARVTYHQRPAAEC
ncbi:MAG: glycosyl transferase [Gemmatimonadales bacterium]